MSSIPYKNMSLEINSEDSSLEIFPSILENDPGTVARYIKSIAHLFTHVQIDIADGLLVDGQTYSVDNWVTYILEHQTAIPETTTSEFHLMVQDFLPNVQALTTVTHLMKIPTILLHFEALKSWYGPECVDFYAALQNDCSEFEYGIVISEKTHVQENLPLISAFPIVQIMTIEAGSQGRPFNEGALRHIKTLREESYFGKIQLDGGINDTTLPQVLAEKYIPNAVCPGSFLKEDTENHLEELRKISINLH